jgi:hypothetical protein
MPRTAPGLIISCAQEKTCPQPEEPTMPTRLELEEYLYRRAIDIIESADSDSDKEKLLFQEVWLPLADLYRDTTDETTR